MSCFDQQVHSTILNIILMIGEGCQQLLSILGGIDLLLATFTLSTNVIHMLLSKRIVHLYGSSLPWLKRINSVMNSVYNSISFGASEHVYSESHFTLSPFSLSRCLCCGVYLDNCTWCLLILIRIIACCTCAISYLKANCNLFIYFLF